MEIHTAKDFMQSASLACLALPYGKSPWKGRYRQVGKGRACKGLGFWAAMPSNDVHRRLKP